MFLLIVYVLVALGFSFLCSVAEAVLLSVRAPYVALLEKDGHRSGTILRELREDLGRPLAAILTLNTVAHTVGAAGAGAQAAVVFGDTWIGVFSAVLTLLILVLSEIIPKSLGATYWRALAPLTAHLLRWLIRILYPFVLLSDAITSRLGKEEHGAGLSRAELTILADVGIGEGQLQDRELEILRNLLRLAEIRVEEVMTPRTVVFQVAEELTVAEYLEAYGKERFSRILVHSRTDTDHVTGFVLRSDLLLSHAKGQDQATLASHRRDIVVFPEVLPLLAALERFLEERLQIAILVDEYGTLEGLVTLEDLVETLIGREIVDEGDKAPDMQRLARRLWVRRAAELGLTGQGDTGRTEPPSGTN